MYQFARIFLHMDFMDSYFLLSFRRLYFHAAVSANGKIQLGYLIILRIVRIKIIFPVELTTATAYSNAFLFKTGRVPGIPVQTGQVWVLGAPPNAVEQPQNIFVFVASST